jgi:hypothetical protein
VKLKQGDDIAALPVLWYKIMPVRMTATDFHLQFESRKKYADATAGWQKMR